MAYSGRLRMDKLSLGRLRRHIINGSEGALGIIVALGARGGVQIIVDITQLGEQGWLMLQLTLLQ